MIIAKIIGGLGNQFLQYALSRTIVHKNVLGLRVRSGMTHLNRTARLRKCLMFRG